MRDMLIHPHLDDYIQGFSAGYTAVLGEMEDLAAARDFPIVGPQVGRLLYVLTLLKRPGSVFEMGSGFGYSTLWFALAAGKDCVIHHTDTDGDNTAMAKRYLAESGVAAGIVFHEKDGVDALAAEGERGNGFDIIFCDVDKFDYPRAFRAAKRYLNAGGIFIADNVLWKGRVVDGDFAADPDTKGVVEATKLFTGDPGFFTSVLSVRDGVLVAVKR